MIRFLMCRIGRHRWRTYAIECHHSGSCLVARRYCRDCDQPKDVYFGTPMREWEALL